MRSRRARAAVLVLAVAAVLAAGILTWNLRGRYQVLTTAQTDVLSRIEAAAASVDDIASAQTTYTGGAADLDQEWLARLTSLIQSVHDEASALIPISRAQGSPDALRTVADAADALSGVDARTRQALRAGRSSAAANLIAEGRDIVDSMLVELRNLRFAESAAFEAARASVLAQSWTVSAGMGVALLAAVFLLWSPLRSLQHDAAAAPSATPREDTPTAPPIGSHALAEISIDISRIQTPEDLVAVLERTARILDVPRLVVWQAADGALHPVAGQGFTAERLHAFGRIPPDADNATARAWRTGGEQVVPAAPETPGALAVPMWQGGTCGGVLAIEIRPGREIDGPLRDTAAIVAAHLSSVITPSPAEPSAAAEIPREASGT